MMSPPTHAPGSPLMSYNCFAPSCCCHSRGGGIWAPGGRQLRAGRRAHGMDWLHHLLLLLTISVFLGLGQPRNPKGKRKGQGRPGTLAPGPQQVPLDLVSRAKPFARMEEYEKNLGDMVAQLRNSSELAKRKCEVNLQLWLSNQRSLSPWGYSINHDPSRIPADLPEARCLCLGCVNPFTMQEDRSMVSVPVFSQVPVRRRLCPLPPRAGPCRQRAVMETIAVGCTCIF
ncbi:interleukin-17B [Phacochoerus africanus]|uniref:interleukin-17B n=1 Tax=Phacochoerus africanus TaxID=41426 RepID=UPI001FDA7C4A|nr:interleukin-17B [Phacochoerus africanus]XP_047634977.1 interleukin-17B [Phacochoerus africanus]